MKITIDVNELKQLVLDRVREMCAELPPNASMLVSIVDSEGREVAYDIAYITGVTVTFVAPRKYAGPG